MRNTTAHTIEICNCWVPGRLKALGGREVSFLPQKSSQRTHLRIEASGKRPREGGREGEVFSGPRHKKYLDLTLEVPMVAGFALWFDRVPANLLMGRSEGGHYRRGFRGIGAYSWLKREQVQLFFFLLLLGVNF